MLAVTFVNDCRYCVWAHTGLALGAGVDLEELKLIIDDGILGASEQREVTAILYAKHYAATGCAPSEDAEKALAAAWGEHERREIMAHIHLIYFSNLCGNSADAWLSRLNGRPVEGGHPVPEAIAVALAGPTLMSLSARSRREDRAPMAAL